ncbi:MAG: hypothetical protein K6G47_09030 [Clostridia bacterium]|nr:hypothetical protein [Clostridia bacterium]
MRTGVGVQNPASYAIWPMIILIVVILGIIGYSIYTYFRKKQKKKAPPKPIVVKTPPPNLYALKEKYIAELDNLSRDFINEKVSLRIGFQQMSSIIRHFVFEATGIQVQNYTLDEIRTVGLPRLDELVTEYYNPEFARMSKGDFVESMNKTKRVIEQWK